MRTYRTSELIADGHLVIGDGYRAKNSELSKIGFPFARAGNINDGFHFEGADCLPFEDVVKAGDKVSRPRDIVFTSKGTVGRFAFVGDGTPRFVFSPQLCYWRILSDTLIDASWLYYWMHGREFFGQVEAVKGQTDMADYVSLGDQRKMEISLPPLPEQRRIAGILSAFDAKIDLLRRENGVLEAMAGAVFREWFVERRAGDWEEVCVSDLADHIKDSVKPGDFPEAEFAHYSLPAFDDAKRAVVELASDIKSNKYAVPPSSILVSKLNPRFPRVWWIDADAPANAICSTEFQVVKPKDPAYAGFLLEFLKSRYATDALMMGASGTSGSHQRVRPQDIFDLGIEVPGESEMIKFGELTSAWLEKVAVNEREMGVLGSGKAGALKNLMG